VLNANQESEWEKRLQNGKFCDEWHVKPQLKNSNDQSINRQHLRHITESYTHTLTHA